MESELRKVVLILTDISGYTRFMLSNKASLVHGQVIITELTKAIINQIEIPLEISKLEGDAVFAYAVRGESEAEWEAHKRLIGAKLQMFFEAFSDKLAELIGSNICNCETCKNIEKLQLKILVHSGEALFYKIGGFNELSGADVIIVHRLLKNSVKSHQYLLLTEAACRDIEFPERLDLVEGEETYDEIGAVKTHIHLLPGGENFYGKIKNERHYSSRFHVIKNEGLKMLNSRLIGWGLKKLPKFNNLPAAPE
ncbi:MAG: hypothetical protein A3F83_10680 [Candidatus Glassbacteria bacterium RIFCSPLOWO2_12_FULL_58_11]|uniref:DUF2652 domain-containing protein n=1 Tax=Candidatus Glassbacteria bacterium RIFCSPLOWO2_12_FULL_58_11 TaxID=1817867 RepID=A0A1F5YX77_9BACT|nr:MAG: hypothetical protein A3F83_10680 [Candidatus Glassbacteria bacterium RIFCSPLOWO2_12_FULL_58_11]